MGKKHNIGNWSCFWIGSYSIIFYLLQDDYIYDSHEKRTTHDMPRSGDKTDQKHCLGLRGESPTLHSTPAAIAVNSKELGTVQLAVSDHLFSSFSATCIAISAPWHLGRILVT